MYQWCSHVMAAPSSRALAEQIRTEKPLFSDAENLDLEVEGGIGRDTPGGESAGAVAFVGRHDEAGHLTLRHRHAALVPTSDHLSEAYLEGEGLLAGVLGAGRETVNINADRTKYPV